MGLRGRGWAGGWALGLLVMGCMDGPTAIRLHLVDGVATDASLTSIDVTIAPRGAEPNAAAGLGLQGPISLAGPDAVALPITIAIRPLGDDPTRRIDLTVTVHGEACAGMEVMRTEGFVAHQIRDITIPLECCPGGCTAPNRCLANGRCGLPDADGGVRADGAAPDAGVPADGGPGVDPGELTTMTEAAEFTAIAVGDDHVCAIRNGTLFCWGSDDDGQTSLGFEDSRPNLVIDHVTAVAAGAAHTCAIVSTVSSSELRCWGSNSFGQLGGGALVAANGRVILSNQPGSEYVQVATAVATTCAVTADGRLFCWGDSSSGQLATGDLNSCNVPRLIAGLTVRDVAVGDRHICATADDGLYCWGANESGQLGIGTTSTVELPTLVAADLRAPAAGEGHTCALSGARAVLCWGDANHGQIGRREDSRDPVAVAGLGGDELAAGEDVTCVRNGGVLFCFGDNEFGTLGTAPFGETTVALPRQLVGTDWERVAVGTADRTTACGVHAGRLYCWGDNSHGELGIGSAVALATTPKEVDFPSL